ncbi:family 16 glycosylhydrolase [Arthrobacter sp. 2MCAF15]|uniref:glycoside hydrolase family 16 protein n=1 Tax=Arthrobacter sp. 2MCAF15 TaxID=3232984 RepID=UPI003F931D21
MVLGSVLALAGCAADVAPRGERPLFTSVSASPAGPSTDAGTGPQLGLQSGLPTGSPEGGAAGASTPAPMPGPASRPAQTSAPLPVRTTDVTMSGDLPGWRNVFVEDFSKGDVPLGSFPGPLYKDRWSAGYKDGTPDTDGQVSGGKSGYYPSKVLSVKNGVLDWFMHSENGIFMGAAPTPKFLNASKNPPRANSMLYGRYSVRYRGDAMPGFKTAWLLWPDSGIWPRDGEIDFPEGDMGAILTAAAHFMSLDPKRFEQFFSNKVSTDWHVATTEWTPGRVEFFIDGRSIGASTTDVPSTPMHFILQTESCLPMCPRPETQGHVYLDWVSIWVPA